MVVRCAQVSLAFTIQRYQIYQKFICFSVSLHIYRWICVALGVGAGRFVVTQ